jgi:subtilisin family serine protease
MRFTHKRTFGAIVVAALLVLGQSAIYAKETKEIKETKKPASLPSSSPKSGASSAPLPSQSEKKSQPQVEPKTDSALPSQSEKKSQPQVEPKTDSALPSQSEKPSVINPQSSNAKAKSASKLSTTLSADCKPLKNGKAPTGKNACSDFIVVFQPGASRIASNKLVKDSGAQVLRTFSNVLNGALVNGPLAKMQALAKNPNVLVVEDDLQVKTTAIQSTAPWGLDRTDQQLLPLSNTFDDSDRQGLNTFSYVVDTGIDSTNSDFEDRVTPGFTAVLDGRGSADCNGHGTHVAGIMGGKTFGVAKKSTLVPVRVLDCSGSGSYSSVIAGLDWIAANHRLGDAAVVNMSLGGPASSTLDGAIRNLITKGVSVVVAAGNSSADACNYSPARVIDAITVGATTNSDARASYSNYGSCLDLFAPGSSITSTWLGTTGTNTISGTSMASPHVAGVVARFISQNPGLTPVQVANSIKTSSTKSVVTSVGTGSPNQLAYLFVVPDTTTVAPVDSSPTFKKTTPRGRFK